MLADSVKRQQRLILFRTEDPKTGLCHLDNTDLAWFAALRYPAQRNKIEERTGDRLPADLVFESSMLDQDRP